MKKIIIILVTFFNYLWIWAQQENKFIREGNKLFKENKYAEAEQNYLKAMEKNPFNNITNFNLGTTFYKQQKYDEALQQFNTFANSTTDKEKQAKAYHNIGNSYLKTDKLEEAIKAYKQSLKLNPKDEDTRYNLAYALEKLKQQQNQNQNNNNQQQNQNKEQDKQNQEKQEQQKQNQQQQQQNQLSKEEAKRLLEALQNEEKNTQEKRDKRKEAIKVQIEKDW